MFYVGVVTVQLEKKIRASKRRGEKVSKFTHDDVTPHQEEMKVQLSPGLDMILYVIGVCT